MRQLSKVEGNRVFKFIDVDIKELSAVTRHRSDIYFSAGMVSLETGEKMMKKNKNFPGTHCDEDILRRLDAAVNQMRFASGAL